MVLVVAVQRPYGEKWKMKICPHLHGLLRGLPGMVDMLHSPLVVVDLHREGRHVANGIHSRDTCFEKSIGLHKMSKFVQAHQTFGHKQEQAKMELKEKIARAVAAQLPFLIRGHTVEES